jgi:hypothetical protein
MQGAKMAQPQLLKMALVKSDVVYTPEWVARDMVEFFNPAGVVLDPCRGDGAFWNLLPGAEWCEIEQKRDFFAWQTPVDWVIGNPPYGKIFNEWMLHSYKIAKNILYLLPFNKVCNSTPRMKMIFKMGKIQHMRLYGDGKKLNWGYGFPVGAIHFKRGYSGAIYTSIYGD